VYVAMAAQLYANTQLALALYEVLQELVEEGQVPEPLAVATLAQVRAQVEA
jgi:RIO-like serine/threonine protein kinase